MSSSKGLVLDSGILLRAVLPGPVFPLLMKYESSVSFRSPEMCFLTVRRSLAQTLERRGADPSEAYATLSRLERFVESIDVDLYETFGPPARERVVVGDSKQWPVVAVALLFDCPIWTQDDEFFGIGIASWRTEKVELYLK